MGQLQRKQLLSLPLRLLLLFVWIYIFFIYPLVVCERNERASAFGTLVIKCIACKLHFNAKQVALFFCQFDIERTQADNFYSHTNKGQGLIFSSSQLKLSVGWRVWVCVCCFLPLQRIFSLLIHLWVHFAQQDVWSNVCFFLLLFVRLSHYIVNYTRTKQRQLFFYVYGCVVWLSEGEYVMTALIDNDNDDRPKFSTSRPRRND